MALATRLASALASADLQPEEIRVLEPRPVPSVNLAFRLGTAVAA